MHLKITGNTIYLRRSPCLKFNSKSFSFEREDRDFYKRVSRVVLRTVFMGTPKFACPSLETLIQRTKLVGVVTQPDRPSGRGKKFISSPVKKLAQEKALSLYQPESVNNRAFIYEMRKIAPDLVIVVAFGQILSSEFLLVPRICCLNLHPSLLPRYRGPAPIPWAIIKGEKETGATIQKIEKGVDEGRIIIQRSLPIGSSDTGGDMEEKLSLLGAELFLEAIKMIEEGSVKYRAQDSGRASYTPKIEKRDGLIKWKMPSRNIHNLVRGLNPYPGAFTFIKLRGEKTRIKIWQTELVEERFEEKRKIEPGEIIKIWKEKGFLVKGEKGLLLVKKLQLPGRNPISGYDFVKGYQIKEGMVFG